MSSKTVKNRNSKIVSPTESDVHYIALTFLILNMSYLQIRKL